MIGLVTTIVSTRPRPRPPHLSRPHHHHPIRIRMLRVIPGTWIDNFHWPKFNALKTRRKSCARAVSRPCLFLPCRGATARTIMLDSDCRPFNNTVLKMIIMVLMVYPSFLLLLYSSNNNNNRQILESCRLAPRRPRDPSTPTTIRAERTHSNCEDKNNDHHRDHGRRYHNNRNNNSRDNRRYRL